MKTNVWLSKLHLWLSFWLADKHAKHSWLRVYKAFQNQDQDQTQLKHSFAMDFRWNLLKLFNY